MFYGAHERETALKETSSGERGIAWHLTLATFEVGTDFHVLDLADLPEVPSVFDAARRHLIEPLRFLHVFVDEVSKPIRRDEYEHLEYVPTQIVAEYLRHLYEHQTGEKVDGIGYRSAIAAGGSNVVLFISNDDCVDDFVGDAVRKAKLTGLPICAPSSERPIDQRRQPTLSRRPTLSTQLTTQSDARGRAQPADRAFASGPMRSRYLL